MSEVKLKDTKFIKVKVTDRNPDTESQSIFVGGNNVIVNGKPTIKHYRIQPDKVVELPEGFVDQLKARSQVGKAKDGTRISIPMYLVEKV